MLIDILTLLVEIVAGIPDGIRTAPLVWVPWLAIGAATAITGRLWLILPALGLAGFWALAAAEDPPPLLVLIVGSFFATLTFAAGLALHYAGRAVVAVARRARRSRRSA